MPYFSGGRPGVYLTAANRTTIRPLGPPGLAWRRWRRLFVGKASRPLLIAVLSEDFENVRLLHALTTTASSGRGETNSTSDHRDNYEAAVGVNLLIGLRPQAQLKVVGTQLMAQRSQVRILSPLLNGTAAADYSGGRFHALRNFKSRKSSYANGRKAIRRQTSGRCAAFAVSWQV
jgi:hypothetical protein